MSRAAFYCSTVCYLERDNKVLFIKFSKKWNGKYCGPGGKLEFGELPSEGVMREFREETGLTLINPKLLGISQWIQREKNGFIFIFYCREASGEIKNEELEGSLEWVDIDNVSELDEFAMNKKLSEYIFGSNKSNFEGKFVIDDKNEIMSYEIKEV